MKQKFSKKLLAVTLVSLFVANSAVAVKHTHVVEKTIKGYYPSFESIGSMVVSGNSENLRVGDILAIPSDALQEDFFQLFDKDGDPVFIPTGGKQYDVAWWKVKPKNGYRWTDDTTSQGEPVTSWEHVEPTLIDPDTYVDVNGLSTSKGVRIPPVKPGERIAFSITPETQFGDPAKGMALYAPDLNYFWSNKDDNQVPGSPPEGSENPQNPNPPESGGEPTVPNPDGGGGDIVGSLPGDAIVNIYIDKNDNGLVDFGIDELLVDHPTVNTTYVAEIKIVTEVDGEPVLRDLTDVEKESIEWHITNGDEIVTYSYGDGTQRVSETFAFTTQATNDDASDVLKQLPDHFSEQGTTLSISFSFDNDIPEVEEPDDGE